jgi:hypothetical protein
LGEGKLQDEYLTGAIFHSLKEAQIVIKQWRAEYNTRRRDSAARLQTAGTGGL